MRETGWHRLREALRRPRPLPVLQLPGTLVLVGAWIGVGAPAPAWTDAGRAVEGPAGPVPLLLAAPSRLTSLVQGTFREVVESARLAWTEQDAAAIVRTSRQILLQLPGAEARASVGRDQAIRLVEGILRRTEGIVVRVQTAREVGPGQGYAELVRQYRVTGIDEVRNQRILLAFREAAAGGGWQLVELRILQAGQ